MTDRWAVIYCIENELNGHTYVGFTTRFKQRMAEHFIPSNNSVLGKAIKKYGRENFRVAELFWTQDIDFALSVAEPSLIETYDSKRTGYNCTNGGDGTLGWRHTSEAKQKLRDAHLGKSLPQHAKDAISKSWIVVHPCGKQEPVFNLKEWCRDKALCADNLYAVAKGRRNHHKNFKCVEMFND